MKFEITARPEFWLVISRETVAELRRIARAHYDYSCREIAELGGFLHSWDRQLEYGDSMVSCNLHQLGLLSKSLERFVQEDRSVDVDEVQRAAYKLQRLASQLYTEGKYKLMEGEVQ